MQITIESVDHPSNMIIGDTWPKEWVEITHRTLEVPEHLKAWFPGVEKTTLIKLSGALLKDPLDPEQLYIGEERYPANKVLPAIMHTRAVYFGILRFPENLDALGLFDSHKNLAAIIAPTRPTLSDIF